MSEWERAAIASHEDEIEESVATCDLCGGHGESTYNRYGDGSPRPCPRCHGAGYLQANPEGGK
jgi:DnaJ-class molecular chaperone